MNNYSLRKTDGTGFAIFEDNKPVSAAELVMRLNFLTSELEYSHKSVKQLKEQNQLMITALQRIANHNQAGQPGWQTTYQNIALHALNSVGESAEGGENES